MNERFDAGSVKKKVYLEVINFLCLFFSKHFVCRLLVTRAKESRAKMKSDMFTGAKNWEGWLLRT